MPEPDICCRFEYLLRRGVSSQRLGMRVLREEGIFELLDGNTGQSTVQSEAANGACREHHVPLAER